MSSPPKVVNPKKTWVCQFEGTSILRLERNTKRQFTAIDSLFRSGQMHLASVVFLGDAWRLRRRCLRLRSMRWLVVPRKVDPKVGGSQPGVPVLLSPFLVGRFGSPNMDCRKIGYPYSKLFTGDSQRKRKTSTRVPATALWLAYQASIF